MSSELTEFKAIEYTSSLSGVGDGGTAGQVTFLLGVERIKVKAAFTHLADGFLWVKKSVWDDIAQDIAVNLDVKNIHIKEIDRVTATANRVIQVMNVSIACSKAIDQIVNSEHYDNNPGFMAKLLLPAYKPFLTALKINKRGD